MKALSLLPLRQVWHDWLAILRHAPLILGIAFAGEAIQHVAEIAMGMFASREAFRSLQGSELRLCFGVLKISALLIALGLSARWLARHNREERPGLDGAIDWPRLLPIVVFWIAAFMAVLVAPVVSRQVRLGLLLLLMVISFPWSHMAVDAFFGRPRETFRQASRMRPLPPIGSLLAIAPVAGAMLLHTRNHDWAFGAQPFAVWALMAWDSVLVAVLTIWMGVLTYRVYIPPAATT